MFGSSLIDLQREGKRGRGWRILSISLGLHLLLLASLLGAQLWQVDRVEEPPIHLVFLAARALPPQPAPEPPQRGQSQPSAHHTAAQVHPVLVQPPVVNDLPTKPASSDSPPAVEIATATTGPQDIGDPLGNADKGPGNRTGGDGPVDPGPLPVGGPIARPEIIPGTKVLPVYTEQARKARIQGAVVLQATIDEQGVVIDLRVIHKLLLGLDKSAADAVSQWRYRPATLAGRPVKVFFTVTVHFDLAG